MSLSSGSDLEELKETSSDCGIDDLLHNADRAAYGPSFRYPQLTKCLSSPVLHCDPYHASHKSGSSVVELNGVPMFYKTRELECIPFFRDRNLWDSNGPNVHRSYKRCRVDFKPASGSRVGHDSLKILVEARCRSLVEPPPKTPVKRMLGAFELAREIGEMMPGRVVERYFKRLPITDDLQSVVRNLLGLSMGQHPRLVALLERMARSESLRKQFSAKYEEETFAATLGTDIEVSLYSHPSSSTARVALRFADMLNKEVTVLNASQVSEQVRRLWVAVMHDPLTWEVKAVWEAVFNMYQRMKERPELAGTLNQSIAKPLFRALLCKVLTQGDRLVNYLPERVRVERLRPLVRAVIFGQTQDDLAHVRKMFISHIRPWRKWLDPHFHEFCLIESHVDTQVFAATIHHPEFVSAFWEECAPGCQLRRDLGTQVHRYCVKWLRAHPHGLVPRQYVDRINADFCERSFQLNSGYGGDNFCEERKEH